MSLQKNTAPAPTHRSSHEFSDRSSRVSLFARLTRVQGTYIWRKCSFKTWRAKVI